MTDGPMSSLKGATMFQKDNANPKIGVGWQATEIVKYGLHYYFSVTPTK
jgi:hypothetical protein